MAKLVSKVYGEAFFELALNENKLDDIVEEVNVIKEAFNSNNDLIKFLNHPKISKEEKKTVIENIFKDRLSDIIVGFLVIIVDKDRYNDIEGIFEYFIDKYREYKNIGVAYVTTALELSDIQKKNVEQRLLQTTKYEKFEMNYNIDKSLIGGMVIKIGDRVLDSSIKTKISYLAKDLSKIQLS